MSEKLSRQELIELVECIVSGGYNKTTGTKCTEEEHVRMVVKFRNAIKHPGGSDLIYYPELVGLSKNPTVEEIVDLALMEIDETR